MDTLLSVEEAARKLGGLSKYTIHAWLSSGKLQRTKVGSRTMIRESELERVIEDGGKSPAIPRNAVDELIEARSIPAKGKQGGAKSQSTRAGK
jgi:excisionase family DNA binding protein